MLTHGQINIMYLEYLVEFNKKIAYSETYKSVVNKGKSLDNNLAVRELEPKIRSLLAIVFTLMNNIIIYELQSDCKQNQNSYHLEIDGLQKQR